MSKRSKKNRKKKRRKSSVHESDEQTKDWRDTGLHLPHRIGQDDDVAVVPSNRNSSLSGMKVGYSASGPGYLYDPSSSEEAFESSPAMLAAAHMGAFGPTARERARVFTSRSKAHQVDIGGIPFAAVNEDGEGPSFEQRQQFVREVMEPAPKLTIANYLTLTEHFRAAAIDDRFVTGGASQDESVQMVRKVWARLRQARIFDLPPYAYSQAHHLSDRYTTEVLAGLDWHHPMGDSHPTKEEGEKMAAMYLSQTNQEFWFDHMPFETVYIGFGRGVPMSPLMAETRRLAREFDDCYLMGLLINEADKDVYEMIVGKNHNGTIATTIGRPCEGGRWQSPMTMMRWISPLLLDLINEYRTIVLEKKPSFSVRRDFKKSGKRQGKAMPIPKPYYVVNLKQKVIDERMRKSVSGMARAQRQYSHRWDVRGHECVKIQRGTLPIDPKLEKKLRKRKYRIYTRFDRILPEDFHRMLERKQSLLKQGEWIAILSWWRESFIKGPPDAPYIPAIRKPAKNRKPTMH